MRTFSITEANHAGISGLVSAAEAGQEIGLSRHGRVVAEVVGAGDIAQLREDRENLREVSLLLARFATDSGVRTSLDDAMAEFGINRDDIEAEISAGLHSLR